MTVTSTLVNPGQADMAAPWRTRQLSFLAADEGQCGPYSDDVARNAEDPNSADDTFGSWLRHARIEAGWGKIQATEALAEVGIKERAYFRWESGEIAKPDPREVRKACLRLGLSTRDAAVALGILTREELELPPPPPPLHPVLRYVQQIQMDDKISDAAKDRLTAIVESGIKFWLDQVGVTEEVREPSADARTKGKAVKQPR